MTSATKSISRCAQTTDSLPTDSPPIEWRRLGSLSLADWPVHQRQAWQGRRLSNIAFSSMWKVLAFLSRQEPTKQHCEALPPAAPFSTLPPTPVVGKARPIRQAMIPILRL